MLDFIARLSLPRKILFSSALVIFLLVANQTLRIVIASGKTVYHTKPFEHKDPTAKFRILFLGDSTAVGTGADKETESVAGWFGQAYPKAHIRNISRNGLRIAGLLRKFDPKTGGKYSIIIIQIGANDIMRLTPLKSMERDLRLLIDRAKAYGYTVAILHSGNIGVAPVFTWPFDQILTARTRAVRALYIKIAQEKAVFYVDLFKERKDDPFLTDINKYYAKDHLHPSGQGYRYWYENIRKTLINAGVL